MKLTPEQDCLLDVLCWLEGVAACVRADGSFSPDTQELDNQTTRIKKVLKESGSAPVPEDDQGDSP